MSFVLDPRLAEDTIPLTRFDLCEVRMMDNAHYPWLVLIPTRPEMREMLDLSGKDRISLWGEIDRASLALLRYRPHAKLNIGALGNIVPQLHVHIVARHDGDAAWPAPVWGGPRKIYEDASRRSTIAELSALLA